MNSNAVVVAIDEQIARLQKAKSLLEGTPANGSHPLRLRHGWTPARRRKFQATLAAKKRKLHSKKQEERKTA